MDRRRAQRAARYLADRSTAPKVVRVRRRPPEERTVPHLAERLLELFSENGWDAYNDAALMELLAEADLPEQLPEKLQSLIVEILYFAWCLDRQEAPPTSSDSEEKTPDGPTSPSGAS